MAGDITGRTNLSALSLDGTLSVASSSSFVGSLVAGALVASTVSSTGSALVANVWASSVSIGGFNLPVISSTSSLVAPFVVQGSASSFTVITWAAANPGDQIFVTPLAGAAVSSLSSGLVAHSHCTQAGQVEFRLSNVSTLVQNQSTRSWVFTRIVPSF